MKKLINIKSLLIVVCVVSIFFISSCEKNTNPYTNLLGTWISTDLIDTVEFRTESDFYKTVGIPKDHFYYSISGDSMKIQYHGTLYIYIYPKNHFYKLKGDILTIDLRNCYGFRSQVIEFSKK